MPLFQLPDEMILVIFSKFESLNHLLRLRLVCRRFRNIINSVRLDSLNIKFDDPNGLYIKERIDDDYMLSRKLAIKFRTSNLEYYKSDLMKTILAKLKSLSIRKLMINHFKIKWKNLEASLNQLKQLEFLQIKEMKLKTKDKTLYLPNLKTFIVLKFQYSQLTLDAPKLNRLYFFVYGDINYNLNDALKILYPNTITHLAVRNISKISQFVNLKYLYVQSSYFEIGNLFEKNLEEIHVNINYFTISHIRSIINDKQQTGNLITKVYFSNFQIENFDDLRFLFTPDNKFIDLNITWYVLCNFKRLSDTVTFVNSISYDYLHYYAGPDLNPSVLCKKFINIKSVDVGVCVGSHEKFIDFICRCKHLVRLIINYSLFNQNFYDKLNEYSPKLKFLAIEDNQDLINDLSFLLSLKNLRSLHINRELSFQMIKSCFSNLKAFSYIGKLLIF